jgi:hypothetical protein
MTVNCSSGDGALEFVGVAVSKDLANRKLNPDFGGPHLRLQVEHVTADSTGRVAGGWDGIIEGFVPAQRRVYGPGVLLAPSTMGGTQWDDQIEIAAMPTMRCCS